MKKAIIAENIKELNEILLKEKVEEIKYTTHVVGKVRDNSGVEKWEVIDRILVIIK